ncbi:MAG TPA: hypothetical protein VH396_06465 [Chitinophagaceae bacterium]|jgi:hypothetical protein
MSILNNEFLLFLSCAGKNNLKYMLIGGYAVNYYGYNRNTNDMDVWLEPTNENKKSFINTLLCMNYSEQEVAPLYKEDFTHPFKATVGSENASLDFLTFVHHTINFDEAYNKKEIFEIKEGTSMQFVPYDFLKDMKLKAHRDKDYFDVARLEEIRNKK